MQLRSCKIFLTTWIPCVSDVGLIIPFLSGKSNFTCIDHNDIVATIYVRGEISLVLATNELSNFAGQSSKMLSFCIYNQPFLGDSRLIG